MPAEYSADTEAILDRLKKEGSYIRNANKGNSLKNVNINLTKMQGVLNAINANVLAQTSAFAGAAATQAKVQQEAAEKARRKDELAEVSDPRQAKLDDLKMKASLLRAKSDLKDAKGPGLIATVKDKASMGFIAKMAAIGGTSFIAGSIIKGALDKIYDPDGTQGGAFGIAKSALNDLPGEIETSVKKGVNAATDELLNNPKISGIITGLDNLFNIGLYEVATTLLSATGLGAAASVYRTKATIKSNEKIEADKLKAKAKVPVGTNYDGFDDPPNKRKTPAKVKSNVVSMNPIDNEFTRRNMLMNESAADKARRLIGEPLKKGATAIGKSTAKGIPFVGPAIVTADLVQTALEGGGIQQLTDEALTEFMKSGKFEKTQTSLADVAFETGVSAGVGAAIGSFTGPGALVTGTAGGVGGLISGFGRMGVEGYQDIGMIGRDSIPNAVEKAIAKQNALYGNQDLSPEAMKNKLTSAATEITAARGILEGQVIEIDEEISGVAEQVDALLVAPENESNRDRGNRYRKRRALAKDIKQLRSKRGTVENQLQNTINIERLSNEETQRFLDSYSKVLPMKTPGGKEYLGDVMSGSGGMSLVSMTNISNYNTTTKGGDTILTTTTVHGDSGGGSAEQTGMLPA
jgi:hypothetical protein